MMNTILVVEDDPHILLGLKEVLRTEGFQVAAIQKGDLAIPAVEKHKPDLIILDVMLPGLDGYEICRRLRAKRITIPILMLTAKSQEIDRVVGLDIGADDYVSKPFGVRELVARIHALLRRAAPNGLGQEPADGVFRIGSAEIDTRKFQVRRGNATEELTGKEVKLLQYFHAHQGEVLSRDRLLNDIWGYNYRGTTRTLDQVIVQLRKKLGDNGDEPKHLLTIYGVGYKLIGNPPQQVNEVPA